MRTQRAARPHPPVLIAVVVLASLAAAVTARAATHSAAACRAACREHNMQASCRWMSPEPKRCMKNAVHACQASVIAGDAACTPPPDLPACGAHHDCPFGTLCVDATCQVVGCGSHDGVADCTGTNRCDGDKCVVAECSGVSANCAKGFHCQPADGPLASISGTCEPDETGVTYCASDTDCIAPGNFNPRCVDGICGLKRGRGKTRCGEDADCFKSCLRSRAAVGIPSCDAAGTCVCGGCTSADQCNALFHCTGGQAEVCRLSGMCFCPPVSGGGGGGGGDGFPTNLPPGNYLLTICITGSVSIPCQNAGTLPLVAVAQFKTAILGAINQWLAATAGSDCARGATTFSAFDGSSFTVSASATCGDATETVQITVRRL